MPTLEQQEKILYINSQYKQNNQLIQTVQHELEQKIIGLMHRSTHDLYYAEEYIKDKGNISYYNLKNIRY
jgi:hypothetical protein